MSRSFLFLFLALSAQAASPESLWTRQALALPADSRPYVESYRQMLNQLPNSDYGQAKRWLPLAPPFSGDGHLTADAFDLWIAGYAQVWNVRQGRVIKDGNRRLYSRLMSILQRIHAEFDESGAAHRPDLVSFWESVGRALASHFDDLVKTGKNWSPGVFWSNVGRSADLLARPDDSAPDPSPIPLSLEAHGHEKWRPAIPLIEEGEVDQLLGGLSLADAKLWSRRYLEGKTVQEIAEEENQSVQNIREKLRRITGVLRVELQWRLTDPSGPIWDKPRPRPGDNPRDPRLRFLAVASRSEIWWLLDRIEGQSWLVDDIFNKPGARWATLTWRDVTTLSHYYLRLVVKAFDSFHGKPWIAWNRMRKDEAAAEIRQVVRRTLIQNPDRLTPEARAPLFSSANPLDLLTNWDAASVSDVGFLWEAIYAHFGVVRKPNPALRSA